MHFCEHRIADSGVRNKSSISGTSGHKRRISSFVGTNSPHCNGVPIGSLPSTTNTSTPPSAAYLATVLPAGPPPITMTSRSNDCDKVTPLSCACLYNSHKMFKQLLHQSPGNNPDYLQPFQMVLDQYFSVGQLSPKKHPVAQSIHQQ